MLISFRKKRGKPLRKQEDISDETQEVKRGNRKQDWKEEREWQIWIATEANDKRIYIAFSERKNRGN